MNTDLEGHAPTDPVGHPARGGIIGMLWCRQQVLCRLHDRLGTAQAVRSAMARCTADLVLGSGPHVGDPWRFEAHSRGFAAIRLPRPVCRRFADGHSLASDSGRDRKEMFTTSDPDHDDELPTLIRALIALSGSSTQVSATAEPDAGPDLPPRRQGRRTGRASGVVRL